MCRPVTPTGQRSALQVATDVDIVDRGQRQGLLFLGSIFRIRIVVHVQHGVVLDRVPEQHQLVDGTVELVVVEVVRGTTGLVVAIAVTVFPALDRRFGVEEAEAIVSSGEWWLDAIEVHTYIDDRGAGGTVTGVPRSDVGAVFPSYGPNRGYVASYPTSPGTHKVCTYGINVGAGGNVLLGCRQITI